MSEQTRQSAHLESHEDVKSWPPVRREAWMGLLQAHAQLTKSLDADLIANHQITLSAYEVLARLAHAEHGQLRMSQLAEQCLLSQSRVSRLVDQLEQRGLVGRAACAQDCRVVHAVITEPGRKLLRAAQETHFRGVQERFFGCLTRTEIEQLARIWGKVALRNGARVRCGPR